MNAARLILRIFLGGVLALLVAFVSMAAWWHFTYYDELEYIKKELSRFPGVTLLKANGNHDVTLEDIWADIDVTGKGPMRFFALTKDTLQSGDRVFIGRVGDLFPRFSAYGYGSTYDRLGRKIKSEMYGASVQVNIDSPFAVLFPSTIRTVQDAVLRYDDIYLSLNKWPRCPDMARTKDSQGSDYCYCVTTDDTNRLWPSTCKETK